MVITVCHQLAHGFHSRQGRYPTVTPQQFEEREIIGALTLATDSQIYYPVDFSIPSLPHISIESWAIAAVLRRRAASSSNYEK